MATNDVFDYSPLIIEKICQMGDEFQQARTNVSGFVHKLKSRQIDKLFILASSLSSKEDVVKLITETINSVVLHKDEERLNAIKNDDYRRRPHYILRIYVGGFVSTINKAILLELRRFIKSRVNEQTKNDNEQTKIVLTESINDNEIYQQKGYLTSDEILTIFNSIIPHQADRIQTLSKYKIFKELIEIERVKEKGKKLEWRYRLKDNDKTAPIDFTQIVQND